MQITHQQFLDLDEDYYVIDVHTVFEAKEDKLIEDVLKKHTTGWYLKSGSFFAFEKPQDRDIVKGAMAWDKLKQSFEKQDKK